jgi:hypothetical protein
MDMDNRFAWLHEAEPTGSRPLWDRVVLQSQGAKSIPTLGSLAPGWVLTFGARPTLNLSKLNASERCAVLDQAAVAAGVVSRFGKRVFQFEHGAADKGSPLGCGLDLAHLHTVALDFDLIELAIGTEHSGIDWRDVSQEPDPWAGLYGSEYLLVREPSAGRTYVGVVHAPTSQFFRKVIASGLGVPTTWDYRQHVGIANVEATVGAFKRYDDGYR